MQMRKTKTEATLLHMPDGYVMFKSEPYVVISTNEMNSIFRCVENVIGQVLVLFFKWLVILVVFFSESCQLRAVRDNDVVITDIFYFII